MTTWHDEHQQKLTRGDKVADSFATFIGSWDFIIGQAFLMVLWGFINTLAFFDPLRFDGYPFIFLNLFMSAEAAFSTPLILMSQNRQSERDRHQAEADYRCNVEAELRIEALQEQIHDMESKKLDKVLSLLSTPRKKAPKRKR